MQEIVLHADGKVYRRDVAEVELDLSASAIEARLFQGQPFKAFPFGNDMLLVGTGTTMGYARLYHTRNPLKLIGNAVNVLNYGELELRPVFGNYNGTEQSSGVKLDLTFIPPPDCVLVLAHLHGYTATGLGSPFCFALSRKTGATYYPGLPNVHRDGNVCLGGTLGDWYNTRKTTGQLVSLADNLNKACDEWEKAEFNRDLTEALPPESWNKWMNFDPKTLTNRQPDCDWTTILSPLLFGAGSPNAGVAAAIYNQLRA